MTKLLRQLYNAQPTHPSSVHAEACRHAEFLEAFANPKHDRLSEASSIRWLRRERSASGKSVAEP